MIQRKDHTHSISINRPRIYFARGSKLQQNLTRIEEFTLRNQMKINEDKSKLMIFNKSRNFDFAPEISFRNGELLEYLEETKLLGIQINSSLKWNSNTAVICTKSMSKMWLLRRMKLLKLLYQGLLYQWDPTSSWARSNRLEFWANQRSSQKHWKNPESGSFDHFWWRLFKLWHGL